MFALVVSVAMVACGQGGGADEGAPARVLTVPAVALSDLRSIAEPDVDEMLADGSVTFQEYEESVFKTVACIRAAGIAVPDPELRFQRKYYRYDFAIPGESSDELFPLVDGCLEKWRPIEDAWYMENQPTENDLQKARQLLIQCLRREGIEIQDDATEETLQLLAGSASSAFVACAQETAEQAGIPGYAGG